MTAKKVMNDESVGALRPLALWIRARSSMIDGFLWFFFPLEVRAIRWDDRNVFEIDGMILI
jgi:hypothetical protein